MPTDNGARDKQFDREFAARRPRMTEHLAAEILGRRPSDVVIDNRLGYDGETVSSHAVFNLKWGNRG